MVLSFRYRTEPLCAANRDSRNNRTAKFMARLDRSIATRSGGLIDFFRTNPDRPRQPPNEIRPCNDLLMPADQHRGGVE